MSSSTEVVKTLYCAQYNPDTGHCLHPQAKELTALLLRERKRGKGQPIIIGKAIDLFNKGDTDRLPKKLQEELEETIIPAVYALRDALPTGTSIGKTYTSVLCNMFGGYWLENLQSVIEELQNLEELKVGTNVLQHWLDKNQIPCTGYMKK